MRTFPQHDPLTDAELERLGDFLKSCKGGEAMNLEELDGFFAALIAGPETVMPSVPAMSFQCRIINPQNFTGFAEAGELAGVRHLAAEDLRVVFDWAHGFMRGMDTTRRLG